MAAQKRRLSISRLILSLLVVSLAGWLGYTSFQNWRQDKILAHQQPWFAPYVDITSTPTFAFEEMTTSGSKNAVLSFVVALNDGNSCTPAWGGVYDIATADTKLDLTRRIARYEQQGGYIAVSFGGLKHRELALACSDEAALEKAYKSVIDEYNISTIDLDLESESLTDPAAGQRRARVIAKIQKDFRASGKPLSVWVTLPVSTSGLTEDGTNAVSMLLDGGVDVSGVNVMTMNYGSSRTDNMDMFSASKQALQETHRQLDALYRMREIFLTERTLWAKIGATPMIGQNDVREEVFSLDDAAKLHAFAESRGMRRLSMWSANRDIACSSNYTETKRVSDSCSGVHQEKFAFTTIFKQSFGGSLQGASDTTETTNELQNPADIIDDPATSPYPVWNEKDAYLQGKKVVWRKNVYEAKWWTRGDIPDNPVLQTWETPWRLVGPVLPGETPVKSPALPEGFYPEWNGESVYDTGARVLFKGTPYEAKWWTKGASPEAASSSPDSSPWTPLTQEQINKIISQ